ncbi:alpha/beta hydrolase [Klebsiella sp. BIGb0407]|uniref:alpha/beta hydrolase n=1 Tax=Klebsiella sp. BIGb0407 TaxID=2940603 RepID=UPI00216964CB|nr:alpha/beta hydrolase [Klebsiella sp. BIGb0407]MCS3429803.1 acetyl esterase/lipase [Klebsiella sp. BIGb0407]
MKLNTLTLTSGLLIGALSTGSHAANTHLPGFVEGAKVINVDNVQGQTDSINGVIYKQVITTRSARALHMDLLIPRNADKKPAILYFPGGGFTSADYNKFIDMRMALAKAGFVVAAVEYRVIPDVFPAPVTDAKAAVRYLRANAEQYGIDVNKIGVLGDSAGGWLAQMLGTTNGDTVFDKGDYPEQSSDVQAVATLYGISNLLTIGEGFPENVQKVHESVSSTEALLINGSAFRDFAGAAIHSDKQKALVASPVNYIHGTKPPFLIMHGSKDALVSPLQSAQLYQALKKENSPVEYLLLEGAEHGDIQWYQPAVINHVVDWFKTNLGTTIQKNTVLTSDARDNL